mmetsp:Transcript_77418/g.160872  ORF Transcript_77418/g.160872 Transcript_77418/m.160872 type:complete len:210 (-) Transcript_77418:1369-1998(-)
MPSHGGAGKASASSRAARRCFKLFKSNFCNRAVSSMATGPLRPRWLWPSRKFCPSGPQWRWWGSPSPTTVWSLCTSARTPPAAAFTSFHAARQASWRSVAMELHWDTSRGTSLLRIASDTWRESVASIAPATSAESCPTQARLRSWGGWTRRGRFEAIELSSMGLKSQWRLAHLSTRLSPLLLVKAKTHMFESTFRLKMRIWRRSRGSC